MESPKLRPAVETAEAYGGVRFSITGTMVPMLQVEIADMAVYFEHHVVMWKDPTIEIELKPLAGAFKRMLAGIPIFMTQTTGRGRIAFSREMTGELFPIHLSAGGTIDVREHQFLAATANVDYAYKWLTNTGFLGVGSFIDTFSTPNGPGVLWLHGFGNVFEVTLAPGEQLDVDPGAWVYKDSSVAVDMHSNTMATGFLSTTSLYWNRFTGPGRIGLQSAMPPRG
jgi:uncharacterized protein (AIM24 family)